MLNKTNNLCNACHEKDIKIYRIYSPRSVQNTSSTFFKIKSSFSCVSDYSEGTGFKKGLINVFDEKLHNKSVKNPDITYCETSISNFTYLDYNILEIGNQNF